MYLFRCDVCYDEVPVQEGEDFSHARSCKGCGQDGCIECIPGDLCADCTPDPVIVVAEGAD